MKKVLSIVLALTMVLACFGTVFAAEFSDVAESADYADAVSVLSDLGVASGYTDGTFKPEKTVTRAEMAAFIIKALGITPSASAATKFSDVPATHWASGYIAYASSLGIISGYTDGTFKPDQTVSYDEAITMLINSLGYTADALTGTYPAAYVSKAKALGILEDVSELGTTGANRGDIAQMLYNTLDCSIGSTDKDGQWTADEIAPYVEDSMYNRLGIDISNPEYLLVDETVMENAAIDLTDLFGAYIYAYTDGATNPGVYAVISTESTFYTDDVDNDGYVGDYKTDKLTLTDTVVLFVNGATKNTAYALKDLLSDYDDEEVTVAFETSGKYITEIYSVQVWDAEGNYVLVDDDDLDDIEDGEFAGFDFVLDDNDEIDTDTFVLVGIDSLDELEEDDVVTVYANSADEITKLEVARNVVTGTVTKKTTSKITVNGTAYTFSYAVTVDDQSVSYVYDDYDFSSTYELYLDYNGTVRFVDIVSADTCYAVLLDYATGSESTTWASTTAGNTLQVKLFTTDGDTVVYDVDEDDVTTLTTAVKTIDLGSVVSYTVEDDLLASISEISLTAAGTDEVTSKGTLNGYYFYSSAVVFVYDDADSDSKIDDGEFSVLDAASAKSLDINAAASGYVLNSSSKIKLALLTTEGADNSVYGIYAGKAQTSSSYYEVYFVVDGEEVTYTAKSANKDNFATTALAKLTIENSYAVKATDVAVTANTKDDTSAITVTTSASVSGSTFNVDGMSFAVDEDALIYVLDDGDYDYVGDIDDLDDVEVGDVVYLYDLDSTIFGEDGAEGVYELVIVDFK